MNMRARIRDRQQAELVRLEEAGLADYHNIEKERAKLEAGKQ